MKNKKRQLNIDNYEKTNEVTEFFNKWCIYQKVIDNNYTGHREAYEILHKFILKHFSFPFSLLDLGCGDASFMSRALVKTQANCYHGVDLSRVALNLAKKNMSRIKCNKVFTEGDFNDIVRTDLNADIIWIGLSLHHLPFMMKRPFLTECRRILNNNGYLMFFEPTLREGESRYDFLNRMWKTCNQQWTEITKEEAKIIHKHAAKADFPETFSTYEALGKDRNFKDIKELFTDPTELFKLICLKV